MGGKHKADGRPQPSQPHGDSRQPTGRPWAAWASAGGPHRMLLVISAVCLCLIVAGVTVAVLSSPGGRAGHIAGASNPSSAANTQPGRPKAPTAPGRATTGPKVTSHGIAQSALRWPPQLKHRILGWRAGPGGTALAAVKKQMGSAMQAAGIRLYPTMTAACASLASDIGTAQAGPPIPYGAMQRLYAKALVGLSRAAADCRNAISEHADDETVTFHVNKVLLEQSRLEFAAASTKLYRATAQLESVHVR